MYSALSGPTDWILRYIKTTFTFIQGRKILQALDGVTLVNNEQFRRI